MKTNFRKLSTGNWQGRQGKYYVFIFKRPHGKWCAHITLEGRSIASEGYFSTYLHTIAKAMGWADSRIDKQQRTNSHAEYDKDGNLHVYFKNTGRYNEILKPIKS